MVKYEKLSLVTYFSINVLKERMNFRINIYNLLNTRFVCGRWLGKGVDDGSTERLLVAELVPQTTDTNGKLYVM